MTVKKPRRVRTRPIATITIREAGKLNAVGRRRLGAWLRKQGAAIEQHGSVYAANFRARYHR